MADTYIIQRSGTTITRIPVRFSTFSDGDSHCVVDDIAVLDDSPVLIVHPLYPAQNEQLVRLILLLDVVRSTGIHDVSVFSPYLPYSRQDKRHVPGEALGIYAVCRMLSAAGCTRLYAVDCHFMRGQAVGRYEGLDIQNIAVTDTLIERCRDIYIGDNPFDVIGPDKGASLLTHHVGERHMHKTRGDYTEGGSSDREVTDIRSDHLALEHPATIIVDDMVSTGGTMLRAIAALRAKGASAVYCVCTHGLFIGDSFNRIETATDGIIVADTVPHKAAYPLVANLIDETVIPRWQQQTTNKTAP